jgi:TatD DNase family protein
MANQPSVKDIFTFKQKSKSFQDVFFDSHAHIQYPDFTNLPQTIQNAKDVNLRGIVCVGIDKESSLKSLQIHHNNPDYVFSTIGNHPYNADKDFQTIYDLSHQNKDTILGIGETGLDYFNNKLPKDIQKESLLNHAKLAKELDLPLILHSREISDTWQDTWDILKKAEFPKAIFHCFTGSKKQAEEIWSHGYKTSFALLVTYPKNIKLKELFQECPIEHLLVETDSPYLPPQAHRGQLNQPSYLECLNK